MPGSMDPGPTAAAIPVEVPDVVGRWSVAPSAGVDCDGSHTGGPGAPISDALQPYAVLLRHEGRTGHPAVGPVTNRRGQMDRQQEGAAGDGGRVASADTEQSGAVAPPGDPIARAVVPAKGEE